ncbi:hypothetical protein [Enterococcus avium]|nr:hypothetical protein [Enterococcus avium]MDT2463431.1 hypothetical protein [Enterococcus avium]
MTTQEELKEIYHTVSKMDIMELKKAYELAETQEEFEWFCCKVLNKE